MVVSDALAGKSVRCSACGEMVFVQAAKGGPPAATGKKSQPQAGAKQKQESAGMYISPAMVTIGIVVGLLVVIGVVFYLGPVRVSHQWDDIDMKARNTVMNVVTYAIKAKLSEEGEYDPAHHAPAIERSDLSFSRPLLAMSMPKKVRFDGKSNNGGFTGYYDTETGEVEADVECGGYTVGGMVNLRKPTSLFHMTAKEVANADPSVQIDGKTVKIIPPPKLDGKVY
jgi:hypothetical protein